jgi:hypothetical protein
MSVFLTDALAFICGIEPPDIAIEKAVTRTRLFLSYFPCIYPPLVFVISS